MISVFFCLFNYWLNPPLGTHIHSIICLKISSVGHSIHKHVISGQIFSFHLHNMDIKLIWALFWKELEHESNLSLYCIYETKMSKGNIYTLISTNSPIYLEVEPPESPISMDFLDFSGVVASNVCRVHSCSTPPTSYQSTWLLTIGKRPLEKYCSLMLNSSPLMTILNLRNGKAALHSRAAIYNNFLLIAHKNF